jgi:hypothetical protein
MGAGTPKRVGTGGFEGEKGSGLGREWTPTSRVKRRI